MEEPLTTPPRPFVPKTEAERESVKQLCESAMRIGYAEGNGHIGSRKFQGVETEVDRLVPKVPRVKRRIRLGDWDVEANDAKTFNLFRIKDGKHMYAGTTLRGMLAFHGTNEHCAEECATLLELLNNPDEPAQPAAAQGGAKELAEWLDKPATNALFKTLSSAWPVLVEHASHIDGAFDGAIKSLQRVVTELQHIALQTPRADASPNVTVRMDGVLLGAVPVGRALTEDDAQLLAAAKALSADEWRYCAAIVRLAADGRCCPSCDASWRSRADRLDALRGLAPTVTP